MDNSASNCMSTDLGYFVPYFAFFELDIHAPLRMTVFLFDTYLAHAAAARYWRSRVLVRSCQ